MFISKMVTLVLTLSFVFFLSACGGSSTEPNDTPITKSTKVTMSANYTTAQSTRSESIIGQDSDGDGGVWRAITPSNFKVAFKKLTLNNSNGTVVELIPDKSTLSNSTVIDLSSQVQTISSSDLPDGIYNGISAEIYYYQITMPINIPQAEQTIRVYLSDDDFSQEGSLGHHQGDITLTDASGIEKGWAKGGEPWILTNLNTTRTADNNGAGGQDAETSHYRGFYGDTSLWNNPLVINGVTIYNPVQGANQDILAITFPLSLTVSSTSNFEINIAFNIENTWLYEDFDASGTAGYAVFNPGAGGFTTTNTALNPPSNLLQDASWHNDSTGVGAEWTPVFNVPIITIK